MVSEETSVAPLSTAVYENLRRDIIDGRRTPGTRLVERSIASEYQVSRVPVREAIHMLTRDGLVDVHPRRGVTVHAYTTEEIQHFYALREILEGLGARLAARRRTPEQLRNLWALHLSCAQDFDSGDHAAGMSKTLLLHQSILDAANSLPLEKTLEPLRQRIRWTLRQNHEEAVLIQEHRAVVQAIEDRNEEEAEALVRAHARHGYVILVAGRPSEQ